MRRRDFLKTAFIFTSGLWVPKSGIYRPSEAEAQSVIEMMMMGTGGCLGVIGDNTGYPGSGSGTTTAIAANYAYCYLVTANCSGTLGTIWIYHNNASSALMKVGVYNSTTAALNSETASSTKKGLSAELTIPASTGWKNMGQFPGSVSVVNGTNYWLLVEMGSSGLNTVRNGSQTLFSYTTWSYSDPAYMPSVTWTSNASFGIPLLFVGIGQ